MIGNGGTGLMLESTSLPSPLERGERVCWVVSHAQSSSSLERVCRWVGWQGRVAEARQ